MKPQIVGPDDSNYYQPGVYVIMDVDEHGVSHSLPEDGDEPPYRYHRLTDAEVALRQLHEMRARAECASRGIDPDELVADGGIEAWMVVAKEQQAGTEGGK